MKIHDVLVTEEDRTQADYYCQRGKHFFNKKKYNKALKWFTRALLIGHPNAAQWCGLTHLEICSDLCFCITDEFKEIAIIFFELGISTGDVGCYYEMGRLISETDDDEIAEQYYELGASKGCEDCQNWLEAYHEELEYEESDDEDYE